MKERLVCRFDTPANVLLHVLEAHQSPRWARKRSVRWMRISSKEDIEIGRYFIGETIHFWSKRKTFIGWNRDGHGRPYGFHTVGLVDFTRSVVWISTQPCPNPRGHPSQRSKWAAVRIPHGRVALDDFDATRIFMGFMKSRLHVYKKEGSPNPRGEARRLERHDD